MKDEIKWEEVQEIFLRLVDLPDDERSLELARCAEHDAELAARVERLLQLEPGSEIEPGPEEPRRFGPYEVVRPVGHGGMGEVVVARRADGEYEHEVAIKILRGGRASDVVVRRFLRERQTLARLDHEYIARLLDGGTTEDGVPYLVMEYVEGVAADLFAARLEVRERLELFVRIGEAVAHAHERGVVHRDLKPANVLVRADGKPRLLDFGIARPDDETGGDEESGPLTRTGHRLFTPEYASPEQVRGETATTRSDVFALGLLLYVFLCGERPWAPTDNLHDLERAICEDEPAPPSRRVTGTTRRRLSGDLDAIVLQCLEKRPARRYSSVAALCADVQRYLDGEPVQARRTHTLERVARYVRRRPLLPVAASLTLVAVTAGWIAWDAEQRTEESQTDLSISVVDRLNASRTLWLEGERDAAERQLEIAIADLDGLPPLPSLEAEILAQKAVFASFRGLYAASLELVARGERIVATIEEPEPTTVAKLLCTRAFVLQRIDPPQESEEAAWAALEYAHSMLPPGFTLRTDAMMHWADELRRQNQPEEAIEIVREAIDESREFDPKGEPLARLLNDQAVALVALGNIDEAVEHYRESLSILEWLHGSRNPSFAKVRLNYGSALFRVGRYDEAMPQYEMSLAAFRSLGDEGLMSSNLHFMGRIHTARGDHAEAEAAARAAVEIRSRGEPDEFFDRSVCLHGIVLARLDRPAEARPLLESILDDPSKGPLLPDMEAEARRELATILTAAGDVEAAAAHIRKAESLEATTSPLAR